MTKTAKKSSGTPPAPALLQGESESDRERALKDLRRRAISAPTIQYALGERVVHGNISVSKVAEVIDEGKIYKLFEEIHANPSSQGKPHQRYCYVAWHDLTPFLGDNEPPARITTAESMHLSFTHGTVDGLLSRYYKGIDLSPDYQRAHVWSESDK